MVPGLADWHPCFRTGPYDFGGSAAGGGSLVNPATGRDRAAGHSPLGLTFRYKAARPMPPTMRGP